MDNIREFKVNGVAYGLNLSEIGAVINDGGTQKELKQYIDSHSGGGGSGASSKVVKINFDWYNNPGNYQSDIKKALEDIYNEISNNRTVTVLTNGFYSQQQEYVLETTNVIARNKNYVTAYFLGYSSHLLGFSLIHYEETNYYNCAADDNQLAIKNYLYLPSIYKEGQIYMDTNNGYISEFISEATFDNETNKFAILKTTVPAYDVTADYYINMYPALIDINGNNYCLSKFTGMKINNTDYDDNFDLIPDGEWYVLYCQPSNGKNPKGIISKSVRNDDGTLDVYLGIKGYTIENLQFYDCTVENRYMQGEPGLWSDKNWTMVSDAASSGTITIDSFIGKRTRVSFKNKSTPDRKFLTLFKRIK